MSCLRTLFVVSALVLAASSAHAQAASPASSGAEADASGPPAPTPQTAAPAPPRDAAPQPFVPPVARRAYPQPQPRYAPSHGDRALLGYRDVRRSPPAIWGTGLGLFLGGYVLNFALFTPIANSISQDRDGADEEDAWAWSLIPIAGPIVQLGVGAPHPAIPVAMGLLQLGGLVTFILGLVDEEVRSVPVYRGSEHDPNMLRIGLDVAQVEGGGQVRLTLTHL